MKWRYLLVSLLLWPAAALAQTASDQLGPATTEAGKPSSESSTILQPADPQQLQAPDAQSSGVTQAGSNDQLQAAGDQVDLGGYLAGEFEGEEQSMPSSSADTYFWTMIAVTALGAVWLLLDRSRLPHS